MSEHDLIVVGGGRDGYSSLQSGAGGLLPEEDIATGVWDETRNGRYPRNALNSDRLSLTTIPGPNLQNRNRLVRAPLSSPENWWTIVQVQIPS
jgi:hypothetical protein